MRARYNLKRWISIWAGVINDIGTKNIALTAAGVAFFAMFSLFPAIAAMIAVWGLVFDVADVPEQLAPLAEIVPADVFRLINEQVTVIATAHPDTLGLAGLIALAIALWSARAGVGAMMQGLNVVYRQENRSIVRHYFKAVVLTLVLILLSVIGIGATVLLPLILTFVPVSDTTQTIATATQWTVGLVVLMLAIGFLHRYGPNRRDARLGWITPGSILATLGSVAASYALSLYIQYFASYNETYGSLGAVIVLMMWLFLNAFFVIVGGSLNAQSELHTWKDTTVGPDRPMGEREAYVADNVTLIGRRGKREELPQRVSQNSS